MQYSYKSVLDSIINHYMFYYKSTSLYVNVNIFMDQEVNWVTC